MKKIILLVLFFASPNNLFSWDSTAAKFYPMQIGNTWSYRNTGFAFLSCVPMTYYDYIIKIDSFVTRPNGKWYFKFSDGALRRIDSLTMNIYRYFSNGECLQDSLYARKNDTIGNCVSPRPIVTDTAHVFWGGADRRKKRMQQWMPGEFYYELVEGLGFFYRISCEGGGSQISLNGAIINGVQYGLMLSTSVKIVSSEVPFTFSLSQNYPNPFNPNTIIRFKIKDSRLTILKVFDLLGREVATLVNEQLKPGTYEVDFDGSNLPSGIYYYKLFAGDYVETKKMVLIK